MKSPSDKLITELALRMIDLGVEIVHTPDCVLGKLACGEILLAIKRGPDLCPGCGKPMIRAISLEKTRRPLAEIFQ